MKRKLIKALIILIICFPVVAIIYNTFFFGNLGSGYVYTDNGDYYQEIIRKNNGNNSLVVPAKVEFHDSNKNNIVAIRYVIDSYEYDSGDKNEVNNTYVYYIINKDSGNVIKLNECKLALHEFSAISLENSAINMGYFNKCS